MPSSRTIPNTVTLLYFWAYGSCQVPQVQRHTTKREKASALLLENGEMAVTLPTAALPGCGFSA